MTSTTPVIEPHVESLGIADLVAHPANRELIDDDLVDLTESLSSKLGLLQYPVVVPQADGGHRIIVGHSRIMSAQQLGWDTIPCIIRDDLGDADELIALLEDNDRHRPLAVSDRARIDAELSLFPGYDTPEKIAKATRRTREQVAGSLAVYRLGTLACRAADSNQLSLEDALDLEELKTVDPKAAAKILDQTGGLHTMRYKIAEARRKRQEADAFATVKQELTADGVRTVLKPPRGFPYGSKAAPLDWLRTADDGRLDPEEFRTHEGYGAVVEINYRLESKTTYVCLDPESQGLRRSGSYYVSPQEEQARAERAAQRAELAEQLAVAADLRLRWLRTELNTQAKAAAWLPDALRLMVVANCCLVPAEDADVLCPQPEDPGRVTGKRITHRVVASVIGALHERAREPVTLRRAAVRAQFYGLLRDRGYELTEIEQQQHQHSVQLVETQDDDAE